MTADQDYKPGTLRREKTHLRRHSIFLGSFQEMLSDISSTLANDVNNNIKVLDNYTEARQSLC
jgi:hypothetical protein